MDKLVSANMKQLKTVAIRVDASVEMGTGHVMRCLTLADALRVRGMRCQFISRAHPGNLIELMRQRGYGVSVLPVEPDKNQFIDAVEEPLPAHAHWLGCRWEQDAHQTLEVVRSMEPDVLVVDHYAIDFRWEEILRPHVRHAMVIDDLADRKHECDFLLDQNWFGDEMSRRYQKMIPGHCVTMLGPRYALLKPEYAMLRALMPPRDGEVKRLLVFLGGSDPTNETGKVMDALAQPDLTHLIVDVVIGVNHPDPDGVTRKAAGRPGTYVHSSQVSLAGWMARADLMISAGGATSWERMCLGLPAIVISIAYNQTGTNMAMHAAGYIDFLGDGAQVNSDIIAQAIRNCLKEPERLRMMGQMSQNMVPGMGREIVCDALLN